MTIRNTINKAYQMNASIPWAVNRRLEYLINKKCSLIAQIGKLNVCMLYEVNEVGQLLIQERLDVYHNQLTQVLCEIDTCKRYDKYIAKTSEVTIEDIKEKVKIVDLIGSPIFVKGRSAMYLSPLRDDGKHPSFCVDIENNVWFDFVIGTGGTVIDLYMQLNNVDLKTAIRELSNITKNS